MHPTHNDRSSHEQPFEQAFRPSPVNLSDPNEVRPCHRRNEVHSSQKDLAFLHFDDPFNKHHKHDHSFSKESDSHSNPRRDTTHHSDRTAELSSMSPQQLERLDQFIHAVMQALSERRAATQEHKGSKLSDRVAPPPGAKRSDVVASPSLAKPSDTIPAPSVSKPSDAIASRPEAVSNSSGYANDSQGSRPSWADITTINANYNATLSPADYTREIPQNATYLDANIARPTALIYGEGLMIDERGMKPEDLRSVKVYEAGGDWTSNDTTGRFLGTIQIPKDVNFLRPIIKFDSGITVADNNAVTLVQPDGRDLSFNKVHLDGDTMIGWQGAGAHAGSGEGNYGTITQQEINDAIESGAAPQHALQVVLSTESLFKGGKGEPWYTGENANVQMGNQLALPKNLTPEDLGVTSQLGKSVFRTMQQYGAYIDDSISGSLSGLEVGQGAKQAIQSAGLDAQFQQEFNSMLAASKVISGASALGS